MEIYFLLVAKSQTLILHLYPVFKPMYFGFIFSLPLQMEFKLCLYHGNGPKIHTHLAIEYVVANKCCDVCGKVANLTWFLSSFRKWVGKIYIYSS